MLLDILTLARRGVAALERGGERAWSADDLLTHGEVLRRLRAGKDNRDARALLDRTERRHAPGDARWRWGDVLDAMREPAQDPGSAPPIPMVDLKAPRSRDRK